MAVIRERVWWQVGYAFQTIHVDIDTTVATVYVEIEGARYRIFVTEITAPAHRVIDEYDGRAGAEPLIGAAQREGLCAIPSKAFAPNMVFFPMVMLVYNLWRYLQAFAEVHKKYFELKITIF
ncbi:MAG: hypothetical protein ONB46_04130 [candidate division KSB1 bacterium]|nr:hypothetical protein [candidate division KSB1 bacterium]MDZ7365192.1 hypothetical protein [candidate division KSB1 bacterium]